MIVTETSDTTIALTANPGSTSTYGQALTFTATLIPFDSAAVPPTGTVQFEVDGIPIGSAVTVVNDTATSDSVSSLHAGGHTIEAMYSGDSLYDPKNQSVTQTVTPAMLTITAGNQTKVYGAALPTLTASYTGFVNGDTALTTQPTLSTTATAHSDTGGYAITASGAVDSDYTITYVAGSLTVTTAPLTITADNQTKVYGAAVPTLTASYSGFVDGDTAANLSTQPTLTTTATAGSHVGSYTITASGAADSDYSISYVPGTLTVTAAGLTITADSTAKTYGQTVTFAGTEFSETGLLTSDSITSVTLTSAGAAATANVAGSPYAIVPSAAVGSGLGNYTIHYANGSLTVNPAPLTVTAVVSPTDIGHGDTVPTPTFTYSGFVNGDTAAAVVSGTPGSYGLPTNSSPAGIYTITPTTIGLSAANYDFHTVVSATLNIHPVVTDILVEWGTGTKSMSILNLSRDLPFADITGFQVKFSDVVNITGTGLSLTSTAGGPTYAPNLVSSGQSTNDASWNLPTAIGIDRLMLALDQAHITASSLTLFGTSSLAFSVLPGDFKGDDVVSAADMTGVNNEIGQPYDVWADLNGTGTVDFSDVQFARSKIGTELPPS